jgi:hypothetical protein
MLPVVSYGLGTCSFKLGVEQKLRMFENRVLYWEEYLDQKGMKWQETRKLHNGRGP